MTQPAWDALQEFRSSHGFSIITFSCAAFRCTPQMADECRAPRDGAPGSVVRGFVASNHPMGLPVPVGAAVGPAAYAAPPNYNVVYNPPGPEHTGVGYPRFPLSNAAAPATYEHVTHDLGVFDRSMTPTAQQYTTNVSSVPLATPRLR